MTFFFTLPATPESTSQRHELRIPAEVLAPFVPPVFRRPLSELAGLSSAFFERATLMRVSIEASLSPLQKLEDLRKAFKGHTGIDLVFDVKELSKGKTYDKLPEFDLNDPQELDQRIKASEILLKEALKYPKGFLAKLDLQTFGVFKACVSLENDGFHAYDARYGGFLYYGLYNFEHGIVGAYYTDAQLPLTFHHEIFHAMDVHRKGKKAEAHYEDDNTDFLRAYRGEAAYAALDISAKEISALQSKARGTVLQEAVSAYAAKSPDEDQADTWRHLLTNLPDCLLQAAQRPELPGSQRIIHVLKEAELSVANGPSLTWWIDVALERHAPAMSAPIISQKATTAGRIPRIAPRVLTAERELVRQKISNLFGKLTNENKGFIVRGEAVDAAQPNPTLQEDIREFGRIGEEIVQLKKDSQGRYEASEELGELVGLFDAYRNHVERHYVVSTETNGIFQNTRSALLNTLPTSLRREIVERWHNPHLEKKLDDTLSKAFGDRKDYPQIQRTFREILPTVVSISNASGVIVSDDGWIITNAHVALEKGKLLPIQLTNGESYTGECMHIDPVIDLAAVKIHNLTKKLPFASFEGKRAPVGTDIVLIGNPDTRLYAAWHVSTGKIREIKDSHPWLSPEGELLGGVVHDAWTYWGHSGCPKLNLQGRIVGTHAFWRASVGERLGIEAFSTTIPFARKHKIPISVVNE